MMRGMKLVVVVLLLACAPGWATGPNLTWQIGQCNTWNACGGCNPTPYPTPCPTPHCPPCGGCTPHPGISCEVTSSMVVVTNCQVTGQCGGSVGMHTQCVITSHIGGTAYPFISGLFMHNLACLGVNGNTVLTFNLP